MIRERSGIPGRRKRPVLQNGVFAPANPSTPAPEAECPVKRYSLSHLSDESLLRGLVALVAQDRVTTAEMLAHIAEVDERQALRPGRLSVHVPLTASRSSGSRKTPRPGASRQHAWPAGFR